MSRAGKGAGEHAGEREPRAPGGCGDRGNRSRQETPGWRALDLHLPAARGRFQPPLPSDGRGGGKGLLKRVAFPREKQRLRSAHSAAGDALLAGWGPGGRGGAEGAGEGCGGRGSGTPSGRGGEARWVDPQELRVCGHSPGVPESSAGPRRSPRPVPTAQGGRRMTSVQWLGEGDRWTDGQGRDQRAAAGPMGERGAKRNRRFPSPERQRGGYFRLSDVLF